jgi:hypothetical protein
MDASSLLFATSWTPFALFLAACSSNGAGIAPIEPPSGVADGGVPSSDLTFANGGRLVARSLAFPGTVPLLVSVHDVARGVDCRFREAADGRVRCLPEDVGAEPADAWVPGQVTLAERSGRLTHHELRSDDGGRFRMADAGGFVDKKLDKPCFPGGAQTPSSTCMPDAAMFAEVFDDAGCQAPLALYLGSAMSEPVVAVKDKRPFAVGAKWAGTGVYQIVGGVCSPIEDPYPGLRQYFIGAALPDDALAAVAIVPRGSGRLALRIVEDDGGAITTADVAGSRLEKVYADRDLATDCAPMRTPDGAIRCVGGVHVEQPSPLFADSACVRHVVQLDGDGPTDDIVVSAWAPQGPLAIALGIYRAGPSVTVDLPYRLYEMKEGACVTAYQKVGYRELGEATSWERFATLEERLGDVPVP